MRSTMPAHTFLVASILVASPAHAQLIHFDNFEYVVSRDPATDAERTANLSALEAAGWQWSKAINMPMNRGSGYVYTTDQITGHTGPFPGATSSRVLVLEAGAGTFDTQTDFYVQFGDGEGAIGQIPPNHWFQFWVYVEDTPSHPSRFSTAQSKLLYLNRASYYPATIDNGGYVYLSAALGIPGDYCPAPEFGEFECDSARISTRWNGTTGVINSNEPWAGEVFAPNLSEVAHIVPNQWTLVKMHVDLSGTDPRASPGHAVIEQWIRRLGDADWTKTMEFFGGVTEAHGSAVSLIPAYNDGFRMLRIPTTVGTSEPSRLDRFDYWLYLDDFAISGSEDALPTYPQTAPAPPQNLTVTLAEPAGAQYVASV